jgi:hypothetical protein
MCPVSEPVGGGECRSDRRRKSNRCVWRRSQNENFNTYCKPANMVRNTNATTHALLLLGTCSAASPIPAGRSSAPTTVGAAVPFGHSPPQSAPSAAALLIWADRKASRATGSRGRAYEHAQRMANSTSLGMLVRGQPARRRKPLQIMMTAALGRLPVPPHGSRWPEKPPYGTRPSICMNTQPSNRPARSPATATPPTTLWSRSAQLICSAR